MADPGDIAYLIGTLIGTLIVGVVFVAVASLVNAVFVRLGCRILFRLPVGFGRAYLASVAGAGAALLVNLGVNCSALLAFPGWRDGGVPAGLGLLFLAVAVATHGACYGRMIRHPETGPIGFGRGVLVAVTGLCAGLAVVFALTLVVVLAVGLAMSLG